MENQQNLPAELLEQLSKNARGEVRITKREQPIIDTMKASGECKLDDLVIGVYSNTGEVVKRTSIAAALHQLLKKGIVERVSQGLYRLKEESDEAPDSDSEVTGEGSDE